MKNKCDGNIIRHALSLSIQSANLRFRLVERVLLDFGVGTPNENDSRRGAGDDKEN
jgi:hypothetical protein